ncbi:lipase class 3 family protein [Actinidia rufa]|uniref:Lipase class 3 family protein n=1 Tax=Actinidia rufa TaxID=165716 RepID=A0A7J0GKV4_9ERIC|nr:lipase class 3 family protein [Actinidia rufa]
MASKIHSQQATGAVVPFHHSVLHDGGISNLVLGYAHCGMVAAARWIAKLSIPCLLKVIGEYPDYKVKIVGHSLGGGTAALLTYILREHKEFSASTCVTFAPGMAAVILGHRLVLHGELDERIRRISQFVMSSSPACMTWELAESGEHFITTIINGSDLVPTFSTASIDDLRSEVTASSWLNDLRDQVERTRVLNVVYRSATALGSRLPSIDGAKARVAGAGTLLRPVSSSTQVVMKRAQTVAQAVVRTRSSLSSWYCMVQDDSDDSEEEEENVPVDSSAIEDMTEGELWYELEKELRRDDDIEANVRVQEEEAAAKEITEEEQVLANAVEIKEPISSSDVSESHRFYPPGRIMHIVSMPLSDTNGSGNDDPVEDHIGIYKTPRDLYSKLRLSRTMINDHYMPMYKRMMERLISELENDEASNMTI